MRQIRLRIYCRGFPVSIHASVKDATPITILSSSQNTVSIHASVKDATSLTANLQSNIFRVSIHASVKDATRFRTLKKILPKVSIHASVKDATSWAVQSKCICPSFNPRICKRCDASTQLYYQSYPVSIHASVKDATVQKARNANY